MSISPAYKRKDALAEEREHLRIAEQMLPTAHSPVRFFNPTGFNHSFYFLRGPNVNICLSGNEKVNEKCNDRRIIYRRYNLNNPKSLGYLDQNSSSKRDRKINFFFYWKNIYQKRINYS